MEQPRPRPKNQAQEDYIRFTPLHALFLACSIATYLADLTLDMILTVTYFIDGFYWYALITLCLVLFPTLIVQFFSVCWHRMDEEMNNAAWVIHSALLGVLHRYVVVISLGFEAMKSNAVIDYQRFYQQQSDVCMLRLFDSFLESAPQLVFHLYVMIARRGEWSWQQAVWTGLSAIMSMISLGWGIAAYSAAMRMTRTEKSNMTWTGMILQTVWRFGMLTARISALILLCLLLQEWIIICLFIHWLGMTLWVVLQNTDFCSNVWEERLYNAVVGVIYCFCFFNLKDGQSRYRATLFYTVIIAENFACAVAFYLLSDLTDVSTRDGLAIGGFTLVTAGTVLGLTAMFLYYGFFHPAGPINPCSSISDLESEKSLNKSTGPDFVIEDYASREPKNVSSSPSSGSTPTRPPKKQNRVQHSRSFKDACPPSRRRLAARLPSETTQQQQPREHEIQPESPSPDNSSCTKADLAQTQIRPDSAYGTGSHRTVSRSTASPPTPSPKDDEEGDSSGASSLAYNNETYMSIEDDCKSRLTTPATVKRSLVLGDGLSDFSQCSQVSADSRITVIDRNSRTPESQQPEKLLKRSPIVKDVTSGFAQVTAINTAAAAAGTGAKKPPPEPLTAPLTILIPNISHQAIARCNGAAAAAFASTQRLSDKTISLDILNPLRESLAEKLSAHDYENLALININRAALGVTHWRTYSDMANEKHDESTAYERTRKNKQHNNSDYSNYASLQYYDIYPLSQEMKEQLYRSLTPSSTAATLASSDSLNNGTDSDTYEPIEAFTGQQHQGWGIGGFGGRSSASSDTSEKSSALPLTLIHHDGQSVVTKQILSLENLREVLKSHETFPMDDPQERGDLYLLAPMRLLTPILEESEHDTTRRTDSIYNGMMQQPEGNNLNRSILTVISEILGPSFRTGSEPRRPNDSIGHYDLLSPSAAAASAGDGPESMSSLVHTIDEIRNTSLCNLFFSSFNDSNPKDNSDTVVKPAPATAAPQVPPRNHHSAPAASSSSFAATAVTNAKVAAIKKAEVRSHFDPQCAKVISRDSTLNASMKSVKSNTLVPSPSLSQRVIGQQQQQQPTPSSPQPVLPKKQVVTPLMTSAAGSRKNILELGGATSTSILNTPKRPSKLSIHASLEISQDAVASPSAATADVSAMTTSSLHSAGKNFMPLSPSSKYETPTPPLRPNQFVRNIGSNRPRRKFSIIKERFESPDTDLYQNISDDLLHNDLSQISTGGGGTLGAGVQFPSTSFIDSKEFGLRPDEKYENLQRGWATSSIRNAGRGGDLVNRNALNRRSMPIMESNVARGDKENHRPSLTKPPPPPPQLGPKPRPIGAASTSSSSSSSSPGKVMHGPRPRQTGAYWTSNHSLSPQSRIFATK